MGGEGEGGNGTANLSRQFFHARMGGEGEEGNGAANLSRQFFHARMGEKGEGGWEGWVSGGVGSGGG